jgi:hypothetical protein
MSDEALYLKEYMFYRNLDNWNPYEANKKSFKRVMTRSCGDDTNSRSGK